MSIWGGPYLDRVHAASTARHNADAEWRDALAVARAHGHTWREIADAAGMTRAAVRHIVNPRDRRKQPTETEASA